MPPLAVSPPVALSEGPPDGFSLDESDLTLDLDRYSGFIESATGITPDCEPSATACYRVGNRLEALIAQRRRDGEWTAELLTEYPEVDSLEQIVWLARFFRRCHEEHLTTAQS